MSRNAAIAILVAAILAITAVGALVYLRSEQAPPIASVPPLPANAISYGTWSLIGCQEVAGDGACRLVRRVINNEAQRVVLSFIVARGPINPLLVIGLPPSIVITQGVTITPGGGNAVRGGVQRCGPQLCNAVAILSDVLIGELSAAQNLNLAYVAANGREVNVTIPIGGFREGYAAWLAASPPPPAQENPDPDAPAPAEPDAPAPAPPG